MDNLSQNIDHVIGIVDDAIHTKLKAVRDLRKSDVEQFINGVKHKISYCCDQLKNSFNNLKSHVNAKMIEIAKYTFIGLGVVVCALTSPITFCGFLIAGAFFPNQLKVFNDFLSKQWDRLANPQDPSDNTQKIIAGGVIATFALPIVAAAWVGQRLGAFIIEKVAGENEYEATLPKTGKIPASPKTSSEVL